MSGRSAVPLTPKHRMSQPSPLPTVPPELLERDSLPALLDFLRGVNAPEVIVDLTDCLRLPTPVVQLLLAATRDGIRLRLQGAAPGVEASLRVLGLDGTLPLDGVTA